MKKQLLLLLTLVALAMVACTTQEYKTVAVDTILQSPNQALEVKLSTDRLVDTSDLIVRGKVLKTEYVEDKLIPRHPSEIRQEYINKYFVVDLEIIDHPYKGTHPKTITVVTSAGLRSDLESKTSVLTPGQEYVLFLTETEEDGYWQGNYLTSFQGRWHVLPENESKLVQESSLEVVDTESFVREIGNFIKAN